MPGYSSRAALGAAFAELLDPPAQRGLLALRSYADAGPIPAERSRRFHFRPKNSHTCFVDAAPGHARPERALLVCEGQIEFVRNGRGVCEGHLRTGRRNIPHLAIHAGLRRLNAMTPPRSVRERAVFRLSPMDHLLPILPSIIATGGWPTIGCSARIDVSIKFEGYRSSSEPIAPLREIERICRTAERPLAVRLPRPTLLSRS